MKTRLSRRSILKAGVGTLAAVRGTPAQRPRIAVVGAGAFGGWTALYLLRQGADVTLFDTWGPGNARASSGGPTRLIQSHLYAQGRMYGKRETYESVYLDMVAQSVALWQENETRWRRPLYKRCGTLSLRKEHDDNAKNAIATMRELGLDVEELSPSEIQKRYSQINTDGVAWALYEPGGGYLRARLSCHDVLRGFLAEGGTYRALGVERPDTSNGALASLTLSDGSTFEADSYVFACGAWLNTLFPDTVRIRAIRYETFFFGTPPDDPRFRDERMPTWLDGATTPGHMGIPANDAHGLKVEGGGKVKLIDPTSEDRAATPELAASNLEYLEYRFPAMKGAPLLATRVCQFENSLDKNFIIDRHPSSSNVWIVGGGSGHGFKHGPAVGLRAAKMVLEKAPIHDVFALDRFNAD